MKNQQQRKYVIGNSIFYAINTQFNALILFKTAVKRGI